ncbi:cytochrome c oxidase subunit II [Rubrolithibacter danxiaensis]|uniref:cytochrome c oxidase subunit II n=1 Tax=Rubrolithibacter danxiaensis TaxID=3390805 RepID=UPI003BF88908
MVFKNLKTVYSLLALVVFTVLMATANAFAQVTPGTENDAASQANTEALQNVTAEVYKSAAYYVLLFILLCIFIGVIGKVLKVYELTKEIQGKKSTVNWNQIQSVLFAVILIISMYGTYWTYSHWGYVADSNAGSKHGERIDLMFNVTLLITTIVFVLTHILLFGFSFKYRGSNKRKAYFYPHNNAIERLWTIIPAVALTVLVLLGFFTWRSITNVPENEQKRAISIEVIGEQFKWNVRYAGADNQLGLRNYKLITPTNSMGIDFKDRKSWDDKLGGEIVIPVNRPVRVTIGSKDILHSFYIPTMRVQMNAVPGMPTYFQFTPQYTTAEMREKRNNETFDYVLLCNKICGAGHYNMQMKVTVVSEQEYQEWLAKQQFFFNDDVKKELQMADKDNSSIKNLALNK